MQQSITRGAHTFRRRVRKGRQVQAPGGGRADQWGPTNIHLCNRRIGVLPGAQIMHAVLVREYALVDNLDDGGVVRFLPNSAKVLGGHDGVRGCLALEAS